MPTEKDLTSTYPLSPQQRRLWHCQPAGADSLYRVQGAIRIEGALDPLRLKEAVEIAVLRHEILRTTFDTDENGAPLQRIAGSANFKIVEHDLRDLEESELDKRLESLFVEAARLPFDLAQGPVLHLSLAQLSSTRSLLLAGLPALCADGTTLKNLAREIISLYAARMDDERYSDEPLQYVDFARWQDELLSAEDAQAEREHWRKKINTPLLSVKLPFEKQSVRAEPFAPGLVALSLDGHRLAQLEALAAKCGTDPSLVLLNCWQILLSRLTGQTEVLVGAAFDGRNYDEFKGALGMLTKFLPLYGQFEEGASFQGCLRKLDDEARSCFEQQEYFGLDELHTAQPQITGANFFSFGFEFLDLSERYGGPANLTFRLDRYYGCLERFKVKLACARTSSALAVEFQYDRSLFQREEIERLSRAFLTLLQSAVANPETAVTGLCMLSELDRRQLLSEISRGASIQRPQECLHELFERQVERTPDAVAVVFENQQLTYCELNRRANQLAHYLRKLGVGPEAKVGVCVERSVEMVIGLFAILKAGGAYVPLDPEYPRERLAFMATDARLPVLLTNQHTAGVLAAHGATTVHLDTDWPTISKESEANVQNGATAENLAYVIYTSGSTGQPKGAMNTHQAICNRLHWMQEAYRLTEADSVLQKTPFSFDVSVWEFFWPLMTGARLVVAQPGAHRDSGSLVKLIEEQQITVMHFVPAMLQVWLEHPGLERCASLRKVICSGEALPFELQERFFERLPAELHNLYGPTEAAIDVTFWKCLRESDRRFVPIGYPIANTQIYILDRHLQPAPMGVAGELHIGGCGLARGYLHRPDLSAEKFSPNPFSDAAGERLYRTGDLARYLSDGSLEFLGRMDYQVKLRGFRIELGEIEAVLCQREDVREAIVIAREDVQGEKQLVAYLVNTQRRIPPVSELRAFVKEKLPDYMIPAAFIFMDALPLTQNGKVDRRALPAPEFKREQTGAAYVAPRNETEATLARVWSEVLGIQQIGINDNFFELGGDSIIGLQIVSRAARAGLQLMPKLMFQYQTIGQLAPHIGTAPAIKAEQKTVTGEVLLTPIQRWFFEHSQPDPHHFNQAIMFKVESGVDTALLELALQKLVEHHDGLRLRFANTDAGWKQTNAGLETFSLERIDISHRRSLAEQRAVIEREAAGAQASLNLSEGPLVRAIHFHLGEGEAGRLLLVIHHLVVDGVSWRILIEDVQRLYQQLSRREEPGLGAKSSSYQQWAAALHEYARSERAMREADFWIAQDWSRLRPLPVDFPHAENSVESARSVESKLTREETSSLLTEVPEVYHTQINEVLLTALARAFSCWSGEQSLLVSMEGHGREEVVEGIDLSRTVGWFTSIYPLLLTVSGGEEVGSALKRVKEEVRRIPQRGIGYGVLKYLSEDAEVRRRMAEIPDGEVSFNYLGQFDQVLESEVFMESAEESCGPLQSQRRRRRYLLEIDSVVTEGQLQITWRYSEHVHERETIERLAGNYLEELREILAHCQSPESKGFTPSDFPEANLSQAELDLFISSISQNR